jgi:hypothetical protein
MIQQPHQQLKIRIGRGGFFNNKIFRHVSKLGKMEEEERGTNERTDHSSQWFIPKFRDAGWENNPLTY